MDEIFDFIFGWMPRWLQFCIFIGLMLWLIEDVLTRHLKEKINDLEGRIDELEGRIDDLEGRGSYNSSNEPDLDFSDDH